MSMNRIVFLSAQIRTGSTFMWHLFKTTGEYTTYFEPDLPNLFEFMKLLPLPLERLHHYHVNSYWDEYRTLEMLPELHSAIVDEIKTRICLSRDDCAFAFKRYLDYLIKSAKKTPMLQFNRSEFRLLWLRSQYPDSTIVHLWRNPRDQWASMLLGTRPQYIFEEFNNKILYLRKVFPVLSSAKNLYQVHYLYHKLSKIAGKAHSTLSLCYDSLIQDPHRNFNLLFELCQIKQITAKEGADLLVYNQRKSTDIQEKRWYQEQESYCEKIWEERYGGLDLAGTITGQIQLANSF